MTSAAPPLDRSEFPITRAWTYCDHAAVGPLPQRTRDAIVAVLDAQMREGTVGILDVESRKSAIRSATAAAIGAAPEEIAFMRDTSDGALLVANGLDWRPGDEIIFSDDEFGANAQPWLNLRDRGVRTKLARAPGTRLTPASLEQLYSRHTRIVAVSYVGFSDGYRFDIPAIGRWCKERGVLLAVDAMQGFGPLPLDVSGWNIDFCSFGVAKWLLSPQGLSVIYVRREHIERLRPALCAWRSVRDPMLFFDYAQEFDQSAARFEGGTISYSALIGFGESLRLLADAGFENIERHVLALTDRLRRRAQEAGLAVLSSPAPESRSGIVLLARNGLSVEELIRKARGAKIAVTIRDNGIRVSPHGYNTFEEVEAIVDLLARAAA